MCVEDLLCLGHSPCRKDLPLISGFLIVGLFLFRRFGIVNVPAKELCVHVSDDSEGLQVAVKLKVVDD